MSEKNSETETLLIGKYFENRLRKAFENNIEVQTTKSLRFGQAQEKIV